MPTVADHQVNQPQTDRRRRGLSGLLDIAMDLGAFRNASTRVTSDILNVGPLGLGMMRSAPACIVAFLQTRYPPNRRVGFRLFSAVAVFGIATVVFALSRSFVASLVALVVIGASDMVSVNIRTSLVQLATPDAMRGRVSAVNMLFIGASGELGAFESGVVAALFGPVESVVPGCIGTLFVAAVWMAAFPALRKAESVHPILHPTLTKV